MKQLVLATLVVGILQGWSGEVSGEDFTPDSIYDRIAQVERISPKARTLTDLVQLGRDYRRVDRVDDALVQARAALNVAPNDSEALLLLGDLQFQRREYRQAMATFDRVAHLRPDISVVQLRRSQTLSALGLGREAEAANALFLSRTGRVRAVAPVR